MLVFPVEGPPYTNKGNVGEFKGPKRRTSSRIWLRLPGKVDIKSSRLMGSPPTKRSFIVGESMQVTFVAALSDFDAEAKDLVVLL